MPRPRLAALAALAALALPPAAAADDTETSPRSDRYDGRAGPHTVAWAELTLTDAERGKELQIRATWPEAEGPFPLVVWSHGAFGSKEGYRPLVDFWAGHGYVVLQATHSDSLKLGTRPNDPAAFRDWASRPADVSFLLDALATIEGEVPALTGRIDPERVGVGGHSFGAHTAQLIGGVSVRRLARPPEGGFRDPRVRAVLLVSPQGRGALLGRRAWDTLEVPSMVVTGTHDESPRTGQDAEWRLDVHELAPAGDRYLVWVEEAHHGFGGIAGPIRFPGSGPDDPEQVRAVRVAGLAFWDAFLAERPEAARLLREDGLAEEGLVRAEHR